MSVEAFLMNKVTPGLWPGERVLWIGMLQEPNEYRRGDFRFYLTAITDNRMIVFETHASSGLALGWKATAHAENPREWRWDELHGLSVESGGAFYGALVGGARVLQLDPIPGFGPFPARNIHDEREARSGRRTYFIFGNVGELPNQARFQHEFPAWLEQRFRSGSLQPTPARRQEQEGRLAQLRGQAAAHAAMLHQKAADRSRTQGVRRATTAMVIFALMIIPGAAGTAWLVKDVGERQERNAEYQRVVDFYAEQIEWAEKKPTTAKDCPEDDLPPGSWNNDGHKTYCHACSLAPVDKKGSVSTLRAKGEQYYCPPMEERRRKLKAVEDEMRSRERRTTTQLERYAVLPGLAAIGLIGFIVSTILRMRERKKLAATPG